MSGNVRRGHDPLGGETSPAYNVGDFGSVVRRIIEACGFDPTEVQWVIQQPDANEEAENFFIWTDQATMQIRTTRLRRAVSKGTEPGTQHGEK